MSVLLVDDEKTLLKKMARSLSLAGFRVETAVTGNDARSAIERGSIKALCLDINLPDCNGLDLLEEIRRSNPGLPVVVVSGVETPDNRSRAARLGARDFLAKPFPLATLNQVISSYLPSGSAITASVRPSNDTGAEAAIGTPDSRALSAERLARVKAAYATRRVPLDRARLLLDGEVAPRPGDLVLARVDALGHHKRLELGDGRRANLYAGDEIVVAYGNRYATDQFEAVVPHDLRPCNLVAAGGIAATCLSKSGAARNPTRITPVGLLADHAGQALNLADWGLRPDGVPARRPFTIAVVGTAMNAGKTTTAANLIHGMSKQGIRVGATKVTGTGAGGDVWMMTDAGAAAVLDFTDAGVPSTHRLSIPRLESIMSTLVGHLCREPSDAIVIEVADGLFQKETAGLLTSPTFSRLVDGVIFAAGDAMGAVAGVDWLRCRGLPVIAVAGTLTSSPLAMREASAAIDLPVLDLATLASGAWRCPAAADTRSVDAA